MVEAAAGGTERLLFSVDVTAERGSRSLGTLIPAADARLQQAELEY